MNTIKINALTRNIENALIKNIKRECPDLTEHFSEHALIEIAKHEIAESCLTDNINSLTAKCIASMENQFNSTHEDQKNSLQETLEGDCEYPLEVIAKMTPRQKINNWLIWNGIQGFTDDILDAVSAAYGIILEPDLNK